MGEGRGGDDARGLRRRPGSERKWGPPAEPEYAPAGRSRSPGGAPEPGDAPCSSAVLRPSSQKVPLGGCVSCWGLSTPPPSRCSSRRASSFGVFSPELCTVPAGRPLGGETRPRTPRAGAGPSGRGAPGKPGSKQKVPGAGRTAWGGCRGRPGRIRSLVAGESVPGRGHSANEGPERRSLQAAWEPRELTLAGPGQPAETCAPRPRLWSGAPALPGPPGLAAPALRSLRAAAQSVQRSRQNASLSLSASLPRHPGPRLIPLLHLALPAPSPVLPAPQGAGLASAGRPHPTGSGGHAGPG